MSISTTELTIALSIALSIGIVLSYLFIQQRKAAKNMMDSITSSPKTGAHPLSLQAYERLVLLTERIALPALIQRLNQTGIGIKEMQAILSQGIREEFEYNITQQMYVSAAAWDAVKNLKDQNLLIIHQIASFLPETATGADLNRSILEMLQQNPNASLHEIVLQVLKTEAQRLL